MGTVSYQGIFCAQWSFPHSVPALSRKKFLFIFYFFGLEQLSYWIVLHSGEALEVLFVCVLVF